MEAGIPRACQSRERVIPRSCSDVGGYLGCWRCRATGCAGCALVCGVLPCIARRALDQMYCVSVLDLDTSECVWVLEHPARVDQSLSLGGDVYVFGCGQLRLDVGNRGGGGEREDVLLVVCSLDVECDLRLFGRRGGGGGVVFGHGGVDSCLHGLLQVRKNAVGLKAGVGIGIGMAKYRATSCWTLLERRRRRRTFVTSARCPASLACMWLSVRLPKASADGQASKQASSTE
jgi:hypothetical protein